MTENSNSSDDNGAGEIAMTQTCSGGLGMACTGRGRGVACYEIPKVLMHSTNPGHLVPRVALPTNIPPLQVADRYAAGRRHD